MKKILIYILLGLFCVNANADEDVMLFFLNDGSFEGFYRDEIDSISYSHYDEDSIWHSEVVMQNIWLRDSVCKIPIDMIDSIRYELPKTEYKSNVIRLDERYTPYISSSDGMSVTFSSNLPASLRPNEGDVLLYEGSSDIFPNGFAGKVTQSGGGTVSCDSVSVEDVYERLYFFGRYLLVEKEKNGVKQYSVRRVKKGKNGNVIDGGSDIWGDYGDDWGIIDNGNGTNVSLPPVTLKQRFDFTKYGISLGTSLSFSAEFTIKCSMVFNVFEPSIFYKCEETDEINGKFEVSYGWEGKPKSDPFIPFKESEVTRISLGDPDKDGHVDWMIVDKDIPVPECPVLTVGAKVGLFMDPKVEAKALMDIETTIKKGYVFSYNLNKRNWRNGGDFANASLPSEITSDVSLEGKVGGSIWAGILCGVNIGFGTSDKGVKENATVKLGPYLDAYLDLNVLDGISDYSWYSALKDSKMKLGVKWGVDVDFTAALKGLFSYKWTQLSVAPKKLIWEKDLYLFPSFEAPTYSVHGDKLLLFANLTRLSVPNYVGIRLVDETGNETTKWLDEPYWIGWGGDGERPFPTSFIFDGLDFKNHRYTAIPVTRIWKFPTLSIPEPAQTCITCTDSNHPHLIDLGLPSGTKWLCTNLYANEPHAAGGFYQWGNKYQENSYDNTYSLPPLGSGSIQGTTYDAATSNLGESYVTPTQQQFEELLAVCKVSEKKSPWDFLTSEGIYLKAPNGANLYLPFAGYKDGTKVTSKGHGHYMLADYTNSNLIKYPILHLYGTPLSSYSSEAGYYGYSVRPISCQNVTRLALSAQTLTLGLGKSETIEITSGSGNYVFERSDDSVIDVRLSGNTLLVKGLKLGTATITVYDRGTGQSEKVEVTVTNEASSLALSTQTLTLTPGKSEIVDVTSGSGSYAAVSNATNVATVTVEGAKLVIKGVTPGSATITVKDNQTQERAKIEVTVTEDVPAQTETFTVNGVSFKMVAVEGGTFWMGSPDDDRDAMRDEKPRHQVTLSSFAIGETEVTQELWEAVMGSNPSCNIGTNLPVEQISRDDCSAFISKLNRLTGRNFRLPTEAEWEYAARGGKNSKGYKYAGDDIINSVAWYDNNSDGETHPVAQKHPNELGLYDMSGNVWEFCQDYYDKDYYSNSPVNNPCNTTPSSWFTMRGGGVVNIKRYCRVAFRSEQVLLDDPLTPVDSNWDMGFRLALSDGCGENPIAYDSCPDSNHPHLIDLGLPSGTKWACCNVGATSPEGYGGYYAWGETEEKEDYDDSTYKWENGSKYNLTKYNSDSTYGVVDYKTILDLDDDVAHVMWGGSWRMPTISEVYELRDNTTSEWTSVNGVYGRKFTSMSNGNSIFLPAAGRRHYLKLDGQGSAGYYWSSSVREGWPGRIADMIYFYSNDIGITYINRVHGNTIRPVMKPNGKPDNDVGGSPSNGDGTSGGSDPTHDEYDDF